MNKKETKIEKFERIYEKQILVGAWITKDDMASKGFFPQNNTNGRDIRFIKSKYEMDIKKEGTKEKMFRIIGKKKDLSNGERLISKKIKENLSKSKCVFTGTKNNIEIDHKNGRYNDEKVLDVSTQTTEDFQPLTKIANNIKREVCKKCIETGHKFDAKELGFKISNLNGKNIHNNEPNGCVGCFFYDIIEFKNTYNQTLCTNFSCEERDFCEKDFQKQFKQV